MNNLICCSLLLQYRVAYFIGAMQGIKMRRKHLQFLTRKALHSPVVRSYPYITICLFFAFLSLFPADKELLNHVMFLTVLPYFPNTVTVLAGSQPLRIKVCSNSLMQNTLFSNAEVGDACLLQEAEDIMGPFIQSLLSRATSAPCAIELVPVSELQGLGCSLLLTQQGDLETDSQAAKVFERSCTPTPSSRLGQLQSQSCVQSSFEWLQDGRFHNLCG